jgi:GNAT superfamily N-acetyltransferase
MVTLVRADTKNRDFIELVRLLDADLAIRDGDDHSFYDQFNRIDTIKYAVVAYENNSAVGCGAIKAFDQSSMEVKRMFVIQDYRKRGVATQILGELERWAMELSYARFILETGKMQPEAIELYSRYGYTVIPNYGQYAGIENSVCFEKKLK